MQFWTSETLKSTKHRVLIPKKTRYSLVYFVVADPETPLKPIYATEGGNVITAKEHLQWQIDLAMGFIKPTGDLKVKASA
jgi:isopenicillin N synthase-like dioxygenase